jgi:hypothetical protein
MLAHNKKSSGPSLELGISKFLVRYSKLLSEAFASGFILESLASFALDDILGVAASAYDHFLPAMKADMTEQRHSKEIRDQ